MMRMQITSIREPKALLSSTGELIMTLLLDTKSRQLDGEESATCYSLALY